MLSISIKPPLQHLKKDNILNDLLSEKADSRCIRVLHRWLVTPFYCFYDFLDVGKPPQKVDVIFVFAGKPERKAYGIELWRRGYAKELILSVGRFEWRGYYKLDLPTDGGLKQSVEKTPPEQRHFFVTLSVPEATCSLVKIGNFGTMSEALALGKIVQDKGYQSLMVVSTPVHLRRIALALRRTFRRRAISVSCVAVPEQVSSIKRQDWWATPESRYFVLNELFKYLVYWLFSR